MAFLLNFAANRELREGDSVRVTRGPRSGRDGLVVGFLLAASRPVVVQYDVPSGLLRENFAANEVEISRYTSAPEALEPLPERRQVLTELRGGSWKRRSGWIEIRGSSGTYALVPISPVPQILRMWEARTHQDDEVLNLLRDCMFTRLPHLVRGL